MAMFCSTENCAISTARSVMMPTPSSMASHASLSVTSAVDFPNSRISPESGNTAPVNIPMNISAAGASRPPNAITSPRFSVSDSTRSGRSA
jgi:hypothetical protein